MFWILSRSKYTKEEYYKEMDRIYKEFGAMSPSLFNENKRIDVSYVYYANKHGGVKKILEELGHEWIPFGTLRKEDLWEDILDVYKRFGKFSKSIYLDNGKYSAPGIIRVFGSWNNVRKLLGEPIHKRNATKEEVLDDIKKFYDKHKTTSSTKYREHGTYCSLVTDRFGGWVSLLDELGLDPKNKKWGKDYIIKTIEDIYHKNGFLSADLITKEAPFTYQSIKYHLGGVKEINKHFGKDVFLNNRVSTNAQKIKSYLIERFGEDKVKTEHTWDWFVNPETGYHLYVDYFVPSENLIIEYDGQQHFRYIEFFHKNYETYLEQVKRDQMKDDLILGQEKYRFIRFNFNERIENDYIEEKINSMI